MTGLNAYERQARLAPGLLALFPISIGVIALGLRGAPVISVVGGLLAAAGGPLVLMNTVRTRGRELEGRLFRQWNGAPTTDLLRLTTATDNKLQKEQWRSLLAEKSGVELPTADDERQDPASCNERYEMMSSWAREQTRGVELIEQENSSYGFVRNLLAIRTIGLLVSMVVAIVLIVVALAGTSSPAIVTGLLIVVAFVGFWVFWPTEERVHEAASRYARQLFLSAANL